LVTANSFKVLRIMVAFVNGDFLPMESASLHVSDLAVQRGYGVFDFLKVVDGHPYFIDQYLDRFFHSSAVMRLDVPFTRDELKRVVSRIIEQNDQTSSGIKLILTGGYSPDGYLPVKPNLVITQHELVLPSQEIIERGVHVITHEYVRDIPEVKTINYTMGIWLLEKVRAANAYDVLYYKDNEVSEFPRSNFFIVRKDDTIVTPLKNVLKGITRQNILNLASKYFRVEETAVTLNDIALAKEAFITSTTKRILPVTRVDNMQIGTGKPGRVAAELLERLLAIEFEDATNSRLAKKI
jgi:branched-chain amino acid aminotransferase